MVRKNSSKGGKKESRSGDLVDNRSRKGIGMLLEYLKQENPEFMSFMDEDQNVILESLRRKYGKRREEGTSMEGASSSSSKINVVDDEQVQCSKAKWECLLEVARLELEEYDQKKIHVENQHSVVGDTDEIDELPREFKEKIQELKGRDVKLLMQKKLFETDLNDVSFSVPLNKVANDNYFLTQKEQNRLSRFGILVSVLDPSLRKFEMCFKKCLLKKSYVYILSKGWVQIVLGNDLKLHDKVQLWSFRVSSMLWFALVKL